MDVTVSLQLEERNKIIEKKTSSEALKRAKKKYYEKMKQDEEYRKKTKEAMKEWFNNHKNDEEYKERNRQHNREYYAKNRAKVLERMRNYNLHKKERCSIDCLLPDII